MLMLNPELSDLHYAHRAMECLGAEVRLARLATRDLSAWPAPMKRMDRLVRLGWAKRMLVGGKPLYLLNPPPLKATNTQKFRHKVWVTTGPLVLLRIASSVAYPRPGVMTEIKPKWVSERWSIEFRGRIRGGWLIRVIERNPL